MKTYVLALAVFLFSFFNIYSQDCELCLNKVQKIINCDLSGRINKEEQKYLNVRFDLARALYRRSIDTMPDHKREELRQEYAQTLNKIEVFYDKHIIVEKKRYSQEYVFSIMAGGAFFGWTVVTLYNLGHLLLD